MVKLEIQIYISIKEIEATLEVNVYACKTCGSINFKVKENINETRLVGNNIVYLKIKNVMLVFNGY